MGWKRIVSTASLLLVVLLMASEVTSDVRWYVTSDWGHPKSEFQSEVADGMARYASEFKPEFILALGDNFYYNGISSPSDPLVDSLWRQIYNHTELRDLHWWLAVGNHDYGIGLGEEWNQVALTDVEPRWHVPHLWYLLSKTDGEVTVDFVVIDTQALLERVNNHTAMMQWLDETLSKSAADWLIVIGHHPIFSCAKFGPVSDILYDELLSVLHRYHYKIDVYLAGHDHILEVLKVAGDPHHFDFLVSGTGGAPLHEERPGHAGILLNQYNISKVFVKTAPAFTAFTATRETLRADFVGADLTQLYRYERSAYMVAGAGRNGLSGVLQIVLVIVPVLWSASGMAWNF